MRKDLCIVRVLMEMGMSFDVAISMAKRKALEFKIGMTDDGFISIDNAITVLVSYSQSASSKYRKPASILLSKIIHNDFEEFYYVPVPNINNFPDPHVMSIILDAVVSYAKKNDDYELIEFIEKTRAEVKESKAMSSNIEEFYKKHGMEETFYGNNTI